MSNTRKASRKNFRRASRSAKKDSRKVSRSAKKDGRRNSRGVFSALYRPVSGLLHTASNLTASGLDSAYAVPATFVKGAKNTVRSSVARLVEGANNIGEKATSGLNRTIRSAFRKNRKDTRRH